MRKNQVGPERHFLAIHRYRQIDAAAPVRKPPLLVELAIVGQEALGNNPQYLAARDGDGAIVDAPVPPQRRTYGQHHR